MKRTLFPFACLLLAAGPALAQFPGEVPDMVRFRLGGIYGFLGTKVQFDTVSPPSTGTEISLSNLLGQPTHQTAFRSDGYWRFGKKMYLDFGYVGYGSERSKTIVQDIHFGDVTYTAGATVASEYSSRYYSGAFRYEFIQSPQFQFGASLGIEYIRIRSMLSATAGVVGPNGQPIVGGASREAEVNVPVPLLGLQAAGALSPTMSIGAYIRAIGGTIDPYNGNVIDFGTSFDWYPHRNFGLGFAYEYNQVHLTKTTDTRVSRFRTTYNGPRLFAILAF